MTLEEYMIYKTMYEEKCEELEIYKKALYLACSADGMFWESEYNDYLREARKEIC